GYGASLSSDSISATSPGWWVSFAANGAEMPSSRPGSISTTAAASARCECISQETGPSAGPQRCRCGEPGRRAGERCRSRVGPGGRPAHGLDDACGVRCDQPRAVRHPGRPAPRDNLTSPAGRDAHPVHRVALAGLLCASERQAVELISSLGTGIILALTSNPTEERS